MLQSASFAQSKHQLPIYSASRERGQTGSRCLDCASYVCSDFSSSLPSPPLTDPTGTLHTLTVRQALHVEVWDLHEDLVGGPAGPHRPLTHRQGRVLARVLGAGDLPAGPLAVELVPPAACTSERSDLYDLYFVAGTSLKTTSKSKLILSHAPNPLSPTRTVNIHTAGVP